MTDVRRIAVYGAESTGKTMLAAWLAEQLGAPLVPEYAREFWDAHGNITAADIPLIAREQWRREDEAVRTAGNHRAAGKTNALVVCDTEALTTVLWSDLLYDGCEAAIREEADRRSHNYALYLLLDVDVPFAPDPQRCFPDEAGRVRCMALWREALEKRGLPYQLIRGDWAKRQQSALAAVRELLIN